MSTREPLPSAVHVLHLDDARFDRELVRDTLVGDETPFHLTECASRAEFEQLLEREPVDVVLSDFNILGYDGLQVIDVVSRTLPGVPVVIVTGTGSEEVAVEALKRGAADYVIKTSRHIRRLPAAIRAVLAHKRLEERLLRAQKLESIGLLAGGIAHDLGNLLTAISGWVALIPGAAPAARTEYEAELVQTVQRSTRLARQLLDLGRTPRPPGRLDASAVIAELEGLMRHAVGERVALTLELAPGLPQILADVSQLEQVLVNLALNARDAMPERGRLVVTTYAAGASKGLVIEVRDTGVGMDKATRARLFEPFFTTKAGQGTGLGLVSVLATVTQWGGDLDVETFPGRGTTFRITLPAAPGDAPAAPARTERASPAATGPTTARALERGRVLVIDDQAPVRTVVRLMLEMAGHEVLEAGSGREAHERLSSARVDLVLSDLSLPDVDGGELCAALRATHPAVPLVLMSGRPDDALAARLGAASMLAKPFDRNALLAHVQAALERGAG